MSSKQKDDAEHRPPAGDGGSVDSDDDYDWAAATDSDDDSPRAGFTPSPQPAPGSVPGGSHHAVTGHVSASGMLTEQIRRLNEENARLRAALRSTKAMIHPSPRDAITDLVRATALRHMNASVEDQRVRNFRDLYGCGFVTVAQKEALLGEAVGTHCRDVIDGVLTFVQDTLDKQAFAKTLQRVPGAMDAYAAKRRATALARGRSKTVVSLAREPSVSALAAAGRLRDSAVEMLAIASRAASPEQMLALLREATPSVAGVPSLHGQSVHVGKAADLLERQLAIDKFDAGMAAIGEPIFEEFPREALATASITDSLAYCALYHPDLDSKKLSSGRGIVKSFAVNEKRYLYTTLHSRAFARDWAGVEELVKPKHFAKFTGPKSKIGFAPFADAVVEHHGPRDLLSRFVGLVHDPAVKIALCRRHYLFDLWADTLVHDKNKAGLVALREHIVEVLGHEHGARLVDKVDHHIQSLKGASRGRRSSWWRRSKTPAE